MTPLTPPPRVLIAGIGNIFFGDDGFGVEVAQQLLRKSWSADVRVVDFGIRGLDLAFALLDGPERVILVDALQRGGEPGTLYLLEPTQDDTSSSNPATLETHGMHPAKVLQMVRAMGGKCEWVRVVGCEPMTLATPEDPVVGLSEPVQKSVAAAIRMVEQLVEAIFDSQ